MNAFQKRAVLTLRGLLGRLAWLAAAGCALGVVVSRGLAEAIGRLTRDAGVLDWDVLGWSAAGCFVAVLLAAALPAVRAARRDPLAVLRGR